MKAHAYSAPLAAFLLATACQDVEAPPDGCHYHGDELHCPDDPNHGLITTVVLHFTPTGGGDTLSFQWSDPEADGNPVIDDIFLPDASDHDHHDEQEYTLDVEVWNDLVDPIEDVTPDIADQAEGHQIFFTGSAVQSPATGDNSDAVIRQRYADTDINDLPVGLSNTITTLDWGEGELTVTLRHLPEEDGVAVKVPGMAREVAEGGFAAIGGDNDVQVTLPIEVQ